MHLTPSATAVPTWQRRVFSSEELPAALGERRRRNLFREMSCEIYGPLDLQYAEQTPFSGRLEFTRLGSLELVDCRSTIERFVRTRRCVGVAGSDGFQLAVNHGRGPMEARQLGRVARLEPGDMALLSDAEPGEFLAGAENEWIFVAVPRQRLFDLAGRADDLVATPLPGAHPVAQHLRRYLDIVIAADQIETDAALREVVQSTLLDLMALVLDAGRDGVGNARARGLRAARQQLIARAIRAGHGDPGFSIEMLASQVGLSPRYVQDLLHDMGTSFTKRVLERRLQEARTMLMSARCADRRVIDIALASGFGAVSYFNRAFRRRFGMSPSEMRCTSQESSASLPWPSSRRAF